jgi:thiol-disulfide isomerase/thioredoxin
MKTLLQILLISVIASISVYPQKFTPIIKNPLPAIQKLKSLSLGDTLPHISVRNIINNNNRTLKTSDYSDQLVILDFWSIGCSSCVAALPKLDSLQEEFKSKIKIIPITRETKLLVEPFWHNNTYTRSLKLSTIVNDIIFSGYFPHLYVPHEVWVYKNKIIAITSEEYVDRVNILKVLSGRSFVTPIKYDFYSFDKSSPIFKKDTLQIGASTRLNYAAVCGYVDGINSIGLSGGWGIVRDTINNAVRLYMLNTPIITTVILLSNLSGITQRLIKPTIGVTNNQFIWDVKDKSKYYYQNKQLSGYQQDWLRENAITVETFSSETTKTNQMIYSDAILQLNQLLQTNIKWIKRKEKIWKCFLIDKNQFKVLKRGLLLSNLISRLNNNEQNPYVFNEVKRPIYLPPEVGQITDLKILSTVLKTYGILMINEECEVDKLLVSENAL